MVPLDDGTGANSGKEVLDIGTTSEAKAEESSVRRSVEHGTIGYSR